MAALMTLEEIPKDIMHANHHIFIWRSFKRSGVVPLRIRCNSVLSSLSQSCHWSPGLVPVQWRVNVGQADCGDGGGRGWGWGRVLRKLWLDITRWSGAVHWWGLQRGTTGWRSSLLSPALPCLQPKPAEQLVKNQKYPCDQKKTNLLSAALASKFLTSHHKSKAKCEFFPYLHYYFLSTGEAI